MFDGRDLDETERLVDDWQAGVDTSAAATRKLSERLSSLTASARSDDGLVRVTVDPSGVVTDLDLAEGIRRLPADVTAVLILKTMRTAQNALVALATSVTAETLGAGSATGRAIIESYASRLRHPDD
jgi:DNA-binding protein YbaB